MPTSGTDADGAARAWSGLLAVAGAAAGLTALVYLVGALTIWARLRAAGFPADIASEHTARGEVLALGLRGIAAVTVGIALAVAIAYGLTLAFAYSVRWVGALRRSLRARSRRKKPGLVEPEPEPVEPGHETKREKTVALAATIRRHTLLDVNAAQIRRVHVGAFRLLGIAGFAAVVVAGFVSWRAFAVTLALVVTVGLTLRYLYRRRPSRKRPSLGLIAVAVLTAAIAGTAWQVQPPIHVQTAFVSASVAATDPARKQVEGIPGVTQRVPFPYFGETADYVYVADLRDVKVDPAGGYSWHYTKTILELPRGDVALAFPAEKGELAPDVSPPLTAVWHAIFRS